MFEWMSDPQAWIALATLTALEIVLGIDNIVFITILVGRLPEHQRNRARIIGLSLAMGLRILLLLSLVWIMRLTTPLFTVFGEAISGRDIILLLGGLFLLWKAVHEIHGSLEGPPHRQDGSIAVASFGGVLFQIALIDMVFSIDSVLTAIGMVQQVPVMVIAILVAVAVMMLAARPLGEFVDRHPTIKMLALSFLVLIGMALIAEGLDLHIPKGYIYFAMAFSVTVELLNLRARKARAAAPVMLHKPRQPELLVDGNQPTGTPGG